MSFFPPIDHIHRRSSSFIHPETYEEFMDYAHHCRDELQVYLHMEENCIGIEEPMFWLTLLQTLKERCQLKLLIKKLTQIKQNHDLTEKPDFIQILSFEETLIRELQHNIQRRKMPTKRTLRQWNMFSISKIYKSKRKIGDGSFQIYVDQENRKKYKLNDLSQFVLDEMKDFVDAKIKAYERKRADRPWSFLGKSQGNLEIWSKELIEANKRNSQIISVTQMMNNRMSTQQRAMDKRPSTSMARKPNISNTISNNNPENDLHKTPNFHRKDKMQQDLNQLSMKKLMNSTRKQETLSGIFTTPTRKHETISKSIMKALVKLQRRDEASEIEELQRQLQALSQSTDIDIDTMTYSGQMELIRQESNEELKLTEDKQIFGQTYSETKNQQLDMGRIQCSSFEISNQSELQANQSTLINCLQSTNTLESLDSNNENIFSNEKAAQNSLQPRNFRRPAIPLRRILTEDLQQRQNHSPSKSDLSISEIQKVKTDPSDELSYQDFLDIDEDMHRFNLNENENLVLETMRKKKIDEIKESDKRRETFSNHNSGIHTEIKLPTRLAHISEEHSYNSEKKYTSRERFSSGIWDEGEHKNKFDDQNL